MTRTILVFKSVLQKCIKIKHNNCVHVINQKQLFHTKCSYCHFLILLIGHAEPVSNNVYWENLAKAFQQNPREIMHGIETSKERLNSGRHMFRDQYGRQFLWDPRFGAIPVVQENHTDRRIQAIPILYYNTVTGYIADNQRLRLLIPHEGYLIKQRHPENAECDPNITPMLSFNDGGGKYLHIFNIFNIKQEYQATKQKQLYILQSKV